MHLVPSTVPVYAPFLLCRHQALPLPASLLHQGFATSAKPADTSAPARPSSSSSSSSSSGESSTGRSTIFAVEIPTADQSPAAAAELALAAASQLQLQLQLPAGALTLVLADDAAASAAAEALQRRPAGTSAAAMATSAGIKVLGLRQACRSSETLKGVLMLAEPKVADVSGESQFTPPSSHLPCLYLHQADQIDTSLWFH